LGKEMEKIEYGKYLLEIANEEEWKKWLNSKK
jgi:hypothetical protein